LHRDERDAGLDARLVDLHDGIRVDLGRGPGLAVEPLDDDLVARELGGDHLDDDGPVEVDLPREVDGPHAATPEKTIDLVAAEASLEGRLGGRSGALVHATATMVCGGRAVNGLANFLRSRQVILNDFPRVETTSCPMRPGRSGGSAGSRSPCSRR